VKDDEPPFTSVGESIYSIVQTHTLGAPFRGTHTCHGLNAEITPNPADRG